MTCFYTLQEVQAQNDTGTVNSTDSDNNVTPTAPVNVTVKDKNGSGRIDAYTLLLPLALIASVLHGWSQ